MSNSGDDQQSESFFCRRNSDKLAGMLNSGDPELNRLDSQVDLQSEDSFRRSNSDASVKFRSNSDASVYSEQTDETSSLYSGSPSPMHHLLGNRMKSPHILSRLRTQIHKIEMDDQELEEELMKARFAKLMLAEESRPVAVTNGITNLFASVFNDYKRLEPLDEDSKATWRREMNFYLAPCEYISVCEYRLVVDKKTGQLKKEQVPICQRPDISSNLPALQHLDMKLMEIMDSFEGKTEITYTRNAALEGEKWWHPKPCIPAGGLSEKLRRHLRRQHKAAKQIHKAVLFLNRTFLDDMDVPESYIESLPKTGKAILGDGVSYNYMLTATSFDPGHLVGYFNLTSEREAFQIVDKLEAAMVLWSRKASDFQAKPSWRVAVKDLVTDADKNTILAQRADATIKYLKDRYPQLSQTSLDGSKIENNKDMGKAILESYSRVLEGLASKIKSMVEDIMLADGQTLEGEHANSIVIVN